MTLDNVVDGCIKKFADNPFVRVTAPIILVAGTALGFAKMISRTFPPISEHVGDFAMMGYIFLGAGLSNLVEDFGKKRYNKYLQTIGKYVPELATLTMTSAMLVTELIPGLCGTADFADVPAIILGGYVGYGVSRSYLIRLDE